MALFDIILESNGMYITEGHFSSIGLKAKLTDILAKIYNGNVEIEDGDKIEVAIRKLPGIKKVEYLGSYKSRHTSTNTIIDQSRFLILDSKNITYQLDIWNSPTKTIARTDITKIHDPSMCNIPSEYAIPFLNDYVSHLARHGFAGFASITKNKIGIYQHQRQGTYAADTPLQTKDFERFKPTIIKVLKNVYNKGNFEYKSLNELRYLG